MELVSKYSSVFQVDTKTPIGPIAKTVALLTKN